MSVDVRRKESDSCSEITAQAPPRLRLKVERLRQLASDRKLTLLNSAVVRHAPFWEDGRTIWELLPEMSWFHPDHRPADPGVAATHFPFTVHQAIEVVERVTDGLAMPGEIESADRVLEYTEYAAESDCFGYDVVREVGSRPRYGVASWIQHLAKPHQPGTILDYYVTAFPGRYYAWACSEPLHPNHQPVALSLIGDIFGNPFRPVAFDPAWRTSAAVALASQIYESRDFSPMPILADALQDAGCENDDVLTHCRDPHGVHVRGCWVVDLVLGKA